MSAFTSLEIRPRQSESERLAEEIAELAAYLTAAKAHFLAQYRRTEKLRHPEAADREALTFPRKRRNASPAIAARRRSRKT